MNDEFILNSSILVVDDSIFILKVIQDMLISKYDVRLALSAEKACELLNDYTPSLILLDLEMPKTNGYEFLTHIKGVPEWSEIPVIFLTGMNDRQKEEKALEMGAVDYILKPISAGVLRKRIQMHLELTAYQKNLKDMVNLKTNQLLETQDLILDILANATTYRDNDTGAHIIRTTKYSELIAKKLLETDDPDYKITPLYANNITKCAKLHDIGKIAIPDNILRSDKKLSDDEFEAIKQHTNYGAQMIDNAIKFHGADAGFLTTAKEIILCHHEWWNGEGYPQRLKGEEIPLSARIMAIADVYDALISRRSYKERFSHEKAMEIIRGEAGTHFDAGLISIVEDVFPEFEKVAREFRD